MLWSVLQVFVVSDKMMSLNLLDMHFVFAYDVSQYLVTMSLQLSQINEMSFFGGSKLSSP